MSENGWFQSLSSPTISNFFPDRCLKLILVRCHVTFKVRVSRPAAYSLYVGPVSQIAASASLRYDIEEFTWNQKLRCDQLNLPHQTKTNKKAQLSLTNPREAKASSACHKLLQFDVFIQRCPWQYWSIFIRLAVVASKICEIPSNSLKTQTYRVQGHPRSSLLMTIKSAYATSY